MVLGLEDISVCSNIISSLKYVLLLLHIQQPCCLRTDFRVPHEVFECIVPVAFKVFGSLDFMLFLYEKVILSPVQVDFSFYDCFCCLWSILWHMDRNFLVRTGCDYIDACHVLVCSWSILKSLQGSQFFNSFQRHYRVLKLCFYFNYFHQLKSII